MTNSWLLKLRATPLWSILTSTSGQVLNGIGVIMAGLLTVALKYKAELTAGISADKITNI